MVLHLGFPCLSSGFVLKIITFFVRSCKLPCLDYSYHTWCCGSLPVSSLLVAAYAASLSYIPTLTFTKLRHLQQPITGVAGDVMFYFCIYAYSNKVEALLYTKLTASRYHSLLWHLNVNKTVLGQFPPRKIAPQP